MLSKDTKATVSIQLLLLFLGLSLFTSPKKVMGQTDAVAVGMQSQIQRRIEVANSVPRVHGSFALMSAQDRRQAIDDFWGPGPSTAEKLQVFDKFWNYADQKYAAFQGINVDWRGLRDRYRPEIAASVSRGRFAAIMNYLSLALRESHSAVLDFEVNAFTIPERGVPLMAVGDWTYNQSGACSTAQPDGSALIYSAIPGHPLGLEPGDRVLGYDGRPWRQIYQELLQEEMPLWFLYWGSSPSSFTHTFESSATMNWHLFETMDIAKRNGSIVHVPTNLMPGPVWWGFCSEQMPVAGVSKPAGTWDHTVSSGVLNGTDIGYVYVFGWGPTSSEDFYQALLDLTQVRHVKALIVDIRYNAGGYLHAPFKGLGVLFSHPEATVGFDERNSLTDHFKMKKRLVPAEFKVDFDDQTRVKLSYNGPIALLVGPGAVSSGDMGSYFLSINDRVRTFGKSTASAFNLPTQPALGTSLDLGPDWSARIAEANMYAVGFPHDYFTHSEFPVDERVWLRPEDVEVGKDTVVEAAVRWINQQP